MRTAFRTAALVVTFASLAVAGAAYGQHWRGSGGWGPKGAMNRLYDPAQVVILTGVVTAVRETTPRRGMGPGVHISLKTVKETFDVHLGPAWFIDHQDVKILTGDTVTITGARIVFRGRPAILAARVQKGDQVLVLRDDTGRPVWAAWRARPAG